MEIQMTYKMQISKINEVKNSNSNEQTLALIKEIEAKLKELKKEVSE